MTNRKNKRPYNLPMHRLRQRYEGVWYVRKRDMAEWALEREGTAVT